MFSRIFRVALKPGQGDGYARAIEQKVIPILQKFSGFHDEIAMVSADGKGLASASGNGRKTQTLTSAQLTRMSAKHLSRLSPALRNFTSIG
jgi:hypothetical protein